MVEQAFGWIGSVAVDVPGGLGWLEAGEPSDDLYSGTAGVVLGCAEAAASGVDVRAPADGALGRLLYLVEHAGTVTVPDSFDSGLFSGWAGVAAALAAWAATTGDEAAGAGAAQARTTLARLVHDRPVDPARCTDVICGDAGLLLALLPGAATDPDAAAAAEALADGLVALAEPTPEGPQWRMTSEWPFLMPGFSHGTAGVAFALAAAGRALGRRDLLDMAVRGAQTLLHLGTTADGWALPIAVPPRPTGPGVNFGWCHGPAGTVRLFRLLADIDAQPRWTDAVHACLQAIDDSGLPVRRCPGYWDNVARCCGTAGVGSMLLDHYAETGDAALLERAGVLAADVVDRRLPLPGGLAWANTEHTATPPDLPPEPGFMQGAAGIAGWLARLHAARTTGVVPLGALGAEPAWV